MFDTHITSSHGLALETVLDLFPAAETLMVASLTDRAEALYQYLAQISDLTIAEVFETIQASVA